MLFCWPLWLAVVYCYLALKVLMLEIQTIQFINSLKWNEFKILKGHIYVKEEEIELITASFVVNKEFPWHFSNRIKNKLQILYHLEKSSSSKWGIVYIKHQMIIWNGKSECVVCNTCIWSVDWDSLVTQQSLKRFMFSISWNWHINFLSGFFSLQKISIN